MKVLQFIPNLNVGGAEIMMENLTYALEKRGVDVKVVSLYNCESPIKDRLQQNGVEVFCLGKKLGFDYSVVRRISLLIHEQKPDVLHSHLNVLPYVYLASCKVPIVHTLHSIASKEQIGVEKIFCRNIYKSRRCTPVAISPAIRKSMVKEHHISPEKIPVIFNGVDLNRYIKKIQYDIPECANIVHVGSLIPLKNHSMMIDAIKMVHQERPAIHVQFLGVGVSEQKLKKKVADEWLEDTIEFVGLTSDVAGYLHQADIFMMPSQYEGMPMSLIEAMGTGLPIIASRVGGIPDMIDDGKSGLLIRPTSDELAAALIRLLNDEKLRSSLGTEAYAKARKFSSEQMADQYIRIYSL